MEKTASNLEAALRAAAAALEEATNGREDYRVKAEKCASAAAEARRVLAGDRPNYQGWANYETWAVKLWMDNEEGTYNYWRERTTAAWAEAEHGGNQFAGSRSDRARILLAVWLKDEHDDNAEHAGLKAIDGTVYADLLNAALSEVDWYEIADSLLGDVNDNAEAGAEQYEGRDA
jgi:hypothetical protein